MNISGKSILNFLVDSRLWYYIILEFINTSFKNNQVQTAFLLI